MRAMMKRSMNLQVAVAGCALLLAPALPSTGAAAADPPSLTQKLNAYIDCINRLSERSYDSRARYFSWASKGGPTGKERIIYGTYTIYDTSDCKQKVETANATEPREPELEAAASAYVAAVTQLEPLLKEANDYYEQQNYKDDKMAKGRALHPRLVAVWNEFAAADQKLRAGIETLQEKRALERVAEIERTEGKKARWHIESTLLAAKQVMRAQEGEKTNLPAFTQAVGSYEEMVRATEAFAGTEKDAGVGSMFVSAAKSYLVTAKQLMRRVRDKVPYSTGDKMMINAGSSWMVEGSPGRLTRDYNQLVEAYNRGARF